MSRVFTRESPTAACMEEGVDTPKRRRVSSRWHFDFLLGVGSHGRVWLAHRDIPLLYFAAKEYGDEIHFRRERAVLSTLNHPNVPRLVECLPCVPSAGPTLVMPLLRRLPPLTGVLFANLCADTIEVFSFAREASLT